MEPCIPNGADDRRARFCPSVVNRALAPYRRSSPAIVRRDPRPVDVAANGAQRGTSSFSPSETSVVRHHRRLRENRIHERSALRAAEILRPLTRFQIRVEQISR